MCIRLCKRLASVFGVVLFALAPSLSAQAPRGAVVVLPLQLIAGKPATLGVLLPDGHVGANVRVTLSSGDTLTTDESGRAHFLAPAVPGILFAQAQDTGIIAAADVQAGENEEDLKIEAAPLMSPLDGQLRILGFGFDGDADRNSVILGKQRAFVLAASPAELVVLPPPASGPGLTELDLESGGQYASAQITLIRVDAATPKILPHKKRKIEIRVTGTVEPVSLEVRNLRPGAVQLAAKPNAPLRTRGGSDNTAEVEAKGLRAGEFSFTVRLMWKLQSARIPAARDFLEAARRIAPEAGKNLFESILKKLAKKNPNSSAVRAEIRKLAPAGPSGNYGALVHAAQQALFCAD